MLSTGKIFKSLLKEHEIQKMTLKEEILSSCKNIGPRLLFTPLLPHYHETIADDNHVSGTITEERRSWKHAALRAF
jgi:hypothetical protein